jgi:hypothetical protein
MPARIDPALALLEPRPPRGGQWVYEIKLTGTGRRFMSNLAAFSSDCRDTPYHGRVPNGGWK